MISRYGDIFRDEAQELLAELESALIELEAQPARGEPVDRVFRVLHTLKGSGAMAGFDRTAALAHELETLFELVRCGRLQVSSEVVGQTLQGHDLLKDCIHREGRGAGVDETRINALLAGLRRVCHPHPDEPETAAPAPGTAPRDNSAVPVADGADRAASIRVRSERLDNLVNMIGELVTIQARLSATTAGRRDPVLETLAEEVERLTWGLRDEVLFIRMLPIGATFSRLRRLVRDVAQQLGKEVELVTSGDETELDKTVIERLRDPLMHLIRNAIDHGIESPEERRVRRKSDAGRIQIAAVHSGPNVILTLSDDGAGLDRDRLLRRALELGLIESERGLGEREIQQLIFAPGFSTARAVTSVSGRGVGMDVVRRAIDGLRGSIEVSSIAGLGTTFAIKLPLTLAIIDGLLVAIGDEQFVIPLSAVEECVELTRQDAARSHGRQIIHLRGEFVPYLRLREHFACSGATPRIEQIVVINQDGQRVGLVVDRVVGSHQTVIKPMGRMLRATPGFSGATILGSGQLALILDVPRLIADYAAAERFSGTGTTPQPSDSAA